MRNWRGKLGIVCVCHEMHSSQRRQLSVWQPWEPLEEGTVWVSAPRPGSPHFTSRIRLRAWLQADPFPSIRLDYKL